jgi:hypothetical protein
LDAGTGIGNATQMRIIYDFNGDGTEVRTETYGLMITDDRPGWETFGVAGGPTQVEGGMTDFSGGSISVELWNAFGAGDVAFDPAESWFRFPYSDLSAGGTLPTPTPDPVPDPIPEPPADPVPLSDASLFLSADGSLLFEPGQDGAVTLVESAQGGRHFDEPVAEQSFRIDDISGSYRSGDVTGFELPLDAEDSVGNATQAQVSYDFDGDGAADRIETYAFFASNDVFNWESYTAGHGLVSSVGEFENLDGGSVQIDVWNVIGNADVALLTDTLDGEPTQAVLTIPFDDLWV